MDPETSTLPLEPEGLWEFRAGQLVLLLGVTKTINAHGVDVDRLAFYDFFAANPFLIYPKAASERVPLALAGFDSRSLNYASSAQRFANRRRRLQHDLGVLASRGLIHPRVAGRRIEWSLTEQGETMAGTFSAMYATAYRVSAHLVVRRLSSFSDKRLRERAAEWLKASDFLVDLYD